MENIDGKRGGRGEGVRREEGKLRVSLFSAFLFIFLLLLLG